jgi:hypothetical protein
VRAEAAVNAGAEAVVPDRATVEVHRQRVGVLAAVGAGQLGGQQQVTGPRAGTSGGAVSSGWAREQRQNMRLHL